MSSPYGPSGGNDPQQPWGQQPQPPQQPYGGGFPPGTPSGGFPAQQPGQNPYGPPQPQPGQQQPYPGFDPSQQQTQQYGQPQSNPYGTPAQDPYGQQTQQYGMPGQQQPNPYGQQPGYGPPMPPKKKSSAGIWVAAVVVVLLVGAVLFTGFVTPAFFKKKIFDNTAVQTGIVQILKDEYKISDVGAASCSGENEVKPNTSFECKVQVGGKDKKVKIVVKTEDGEYEVGQPTG
ncbi:DUF4333 domain-containing protein [Lentzea sp. NBRC 102530]|uniref:DUF4333 domain-containing protein n=1 Tax=Lentzea sp. NBRC 102530 TaxID=3032201 RepID=UPI0024A470A5|nr:DUF4333 domain-containing protein [Lentzea sp. NBRC 102530]GLY51578.1 hypothetical protein Lesp01_52340 [Lentzea sp. NBRC 102530]